MAFSLRHTPYDVKTDIDVGAEMYHENYHEEVDGSKFMQEEGWMYGVNGAATFHFSDEHGVKLSGRYARGSSDYTGAYQGQPYGSLTSNGQDRYVYELRGVYQNTSSWDGQLSHVLYRPGLPQPDRPPRPIR
ncbi:hypothetical protein [Paludibacterium denitrificans]|uniref:Uncharacterized protein n=1 Tax=Paludibacterium denitrificans TaxID=2675226 RepID=A0A844GDL9_9NEIS|nr:hypothetical protein [Paludibacterium denitrificans]MTD33017.1 hypothetical protein [Paludibacterium denitrificans]